ncbi:hypothetical protein M8J76_015304 [Diaphorina citri]|nr:hypothetical protein M8J75_007333 [Diaphorina citri]KAI5741605.1 hypothetical protein M8J76_015304 [Diaphorina citri]KAI5746824.1 hypothetical protein M8J77_007818 [Diaphorina citri]
MVKYFENKTVFRFNWEQVAQGYWRRYPNPESTHVLSEDIVDQRITDNKLFTKRILTKTNNAPKWGERFIKTNKIKIVEESICDPKEKTLTTYTRNIGYTSVMSVIEKVEYKVSDENENWTLAKRSVWIDSKMYGFSLAIQKFGLERYKKNILKMTNGFNFILNAMFPNVLQQNANLASTMSSTNQNFAINPDKLKEKAKKVTSDFATKSSKLLNVPNPS